VKCPPSGGDGCRKGAEARDKRYKKPEEKIGQFKKIRSEVGEFLGGETHWGSPPEGQMHEEGKGTRPGSSRSDEVQPIAGGGEKGKGKNTKEDGESTGESSKT